MDSHSNTCSNIALVNRQTGRLVSARMRGMENTSNANSRWNIIEDKDDENDIVMGHPCIPSTSRSPIITASSRFIHTHNSNSISIGMMKSKMMAKKGSYQPFNSTKLSGSASNYSSGLRRNSSSLQRRNTTPNPKYSYKLRNMLQTDLKMGGDNISLSTISSNTTSSTTRPEKLTTATSTDTSTTMSTESSHRRKIRKMNSLKDVFSKDIQSLLNTLQSDEFVGTIHPQYHARYVSDESLM